jgi:hypothetical protein
MLRVQKREITIRFMIAGCVDSVAVCSGARKDPRAHDLINRNFDNISRRVLTVSRCIFFTITVVASLAYHHIHRRVKHKHSELAAVVRRRLPDRFVPFNDGIVTAAIVLNDSIAEDCFFFMPHLNGLPMSN